MVSVAVTAHGEVMQDPTAMGVPEMGSVIDTLISPPAGVMVTVAVRHCPSPMSPTPQTV